jgi:putative membrane protein
VLVLIGVGLAAVAYARGVRELWRRAGPGRSVSRAQAGLFYLGLLTIVLALASPLDWIAHQLFAAHMVQHLLLMLVAAPLLVLGAPLLPLLFALPAPARSRSRALARLGRTPLAIAFVLHSLALWLWHIPSLYDAALAVDWLHVLEHVSFVGTAVLFWWATLRSGRVGYGVAVLFVFALALESTILGALLTFSRGPWYASHLTTTLAWGLSPLEDQQLAGLIMWIPGGLVYLVSALALFSRLFVRTPDPEPHTPARR